MGVMRFLIDPTDREDLRSAAPRAYMSALDGRVFPAHVELDGSAIVLRRIAGDSGRFHIAYPVEGFGRPVVETSSLRESAEPYLLAVELARGKLGQVRDQAAAWTQAGMTLPAEVTDLLREANRLFGRAACSQAEPAAAVAVAETVLARSFAAAERLTEAYVRQRLTARRRRSPNLPVLLSCPLGPVAPSSEWDRPFGAAFTAATLHVDWAAIEPAQGEQIWEITDRQIAWAEENRLLLVGGTLLDFSPDGLPQWLWPYANDYSSLQSFVCDFVETVLSRYASRIRLWEIAARANSGGALALDEEHRLAIVARAVEVARQTDDECQLTLRVDRPWAEYQAEGGHRLSPLQFVDAVVRSGVGLSGVTLEIAVGYEPGGSAPRDRLELSRLIDVWSTLSLPLTVSLAFPSQARPDPRAGEGIAVAEPQWRERWSEETQAEWLAETLPLLMAKPTVSGIEWSHFSDAVPHRYPHAGLLRGDGTVKPAFERLSRYRQSYWQRSRDESRPPE